MTTSNLKKETTTKSLPAPKIESTVMERLQAAIEKLEPLEQQNLLKFLEGDCGIFKGEDLPWAWFGFKKTEHLLGAVLFWVFKSSDHPEFMKIYNQVMMGNHEQGMLEMNKPLQPDTPATGENDDKGAT